ncbi:putative translocation protein involved in type-III secretion process (plasmid) [Sinorhizobium sojae CCBAU 05684]|uniref:Putative translocation protein involved in type-III secretion process n=1 Tax=Sinorhizobium sojae CCBAU 05684 TaxID=716928 RepID=A0A249PJ61_9HYPH|nr:FliM/FliN family flagellar motor switch protein [Sinorhizobium sojae]ASY65734.1 putative translocation protein involved in type-III secretion process [Sinorhizobium sojae CCBAU 05684]
MTDVAAAPKNMSGARGPNSEPGARQPWRLPFQKGAITIRPAATDIAADRLGEAVAIRAAVAGDNVELLVPAAALSLIVGRLEPLAQWECLSPEARAAVLECLIGDAIETVETGSGRQIHLTEIGEPRLSRGDANFGFVVEWDGLSLPVCGRFPEALRLELYRWAGRLPRRSYSGLQATIAIRRGYAVLPLQGIRKLSTGDAIVFDADDGDTFFAVTGERYLAACTRSETGVVLAEPLLSRPRGPTRHFMTNDTIDQELQGVPQPSPIAEMPIKLVFDAGRLEVPLGELESLGEGHVFPLERAMSEAVEIVAQGRIIGRGEIVAVAGLAAVRITALHD